MNRQKSIALGIKYLQKIYMCIENYPVHCRKLGTDTLSLQMIFLIRYIKICTYRNCTSECQNSSVFREKKTKNLHKFSIDLHLQRNKTIGFHGEIKNIYHIDEWNDSNDDIFIYFLNCLLSNPIFNKNETIIRIL